MGLYDINGNTVFSNLTNEYANPNHIDVSNYTTAIGSDFGNEQVTYFKDYMAVPESRKIYVRLALSSVIAGVTGLYVACYDSNETLLYVLGTDGHPIKTSVMRYGTNVVMSNGEIVSTSKVQMIVIEDEDVSCVRFRSPYSANDVTLFPYLIFSDKDITDLAVLPEQYPLEAPKSMLMVGDSLLNWGGGNDYADGFLKIVHEKTGVATTNEGLAGAWWQEGEGQTQCGVTRVNTLIEDQRKYDMYCFMLGTNQGSTTDTGETSADTSTMCGAIRYCMETLKAYEPTKPILICLPPQRAEGNENQERVNEVIKTIVESYGVKTLDIYHNGGIVPNTKIASINYLTDGLHLDVNGYTVLGNLLSAEINYLL